MSLANMMVKSKTVQMEYPGFPEFKIDVAYLTRDELMNLKKKCTTQKFNKKTKLLEDDTDSELFQDIYIGAVIKGWAGLKYSYLKKMLPLEIPEEEYGDGEGFYPYSVDDAVLLMKNNTDLDSWITEMLSDVENFTQNS